MVIDEGNGEGGNLGHMHCWEMKRGRRGWRGGRARLGQRGTTGEDGVKAGEGGMGGRGSWQCPDEELMRRRTRRDETRTESQDGLGLRMSRERRQSSSILRLVLSLIDKEKNLKQFLQLWSLRNEECDGSEEEERREPLEQLGSKTLQLFPLSHADKRKKISAWKTELLIQIMSLWRKDWKDFFLCGISRPGKRTSSQLIICQGFILTFVRLWLLKWEPGSF